MFIYICIVMVNIVFFLNKLWLLMVLVRLYLRCEEVNFFIGYGLFLIVIV